MAQLPPSPFLNSVAPSPAAIDTAAADQVAPQVAAAELITIARTDVLQTVGTTVSAHGDAITACRDRDHASVLDVSSAGMLMQDRPVTNLIQSSDGGQWPTADAPSLGNPHQRSSEPIASGHGIDPTGPSEAIPASTIADPDGGYMGHRLSPALGTSVGMAAIDSCQEPVAASPNSAASSDNLGCLTAEDEALYWQLRRADNPFTRDLAEIPDPHALFDAIEPPPLFLQRQA